MTPNKTERALRAIEEEIASLEITRKGLVQDELAAVGARKTHAAKRAACEASRCWGKIKGLEIAFEILENA